ncbi:MAG: polyphosphate kinase 2 family protein [Bacteroidales bacterium]|nr:polyphosphate kinase 2 family protein [Bacteroidales bacterium]
MEFDINKIIVPAGKKISLKDDFKTDYVGNYSKDVAKDSLKRNRKKLAELQEVFWADDKYSLLIILQAPDAAGKDGAIRHVMSGVNPQGCKVTGFKTPSKIELDHNFLWRHYKELPQRGQIGIFNRSHYENVLITKVHPEYILNEKLPDIDAVDKVNDSFWQKRYCQINDFEREIYENGTHILKFFLNLSKNEQKQRFLDRLNDPNKNWKFSSGDLKERKYWADYQTVYQDMLNNTSTEYAPWYVIPADHKWFSRMVIGEIIVEKLKSLNLKFPPSEDPKRLEEAKKMLDNE